jgi:vacuolar-type H+-ATPase subunit D/Vma8
VELLDHKRHALSMELHSLEALRAETEQHWNGLYLTARIWTGRALALAGADRMVVVTEHMAGRAELQVTWNRTLGVERPTGVSVSIPPLPEDLVVASGWTMVEAGDAHCSAVKAAADYAAADLACTCIRQELRATERRQRSVERIRIPALGSELRALNLRLEEIEREERATGARARQRQASPRSDTS